MYYDYIYNSSFIITPFTKKATTKLQIIKKKRGCEKTQPNERRT